MRYYNYNVNTEKFTSEFQSEALDLWVQAAVEDCEPTLEKIQAVEELLSRPEFDDYYDSLYPHEGKIRYAMLEENNLDYLVNYPWDSNEVGCELGYWWNKNRAELSEEENKKVLEFVVKSEDEDLQEGFFEALGISKKRVVNVLDQVAEILPAELRADLSEVADKVIAVSVWN